MMKPVVAGKLLLSVSLLSFFLLAMRAWAQAPFDIKRGPDAGSAKEGRAQKAITEIEKISVKAGAGEEAMDEVFARSQSAINRLANIGVEALPSIERAVLNSSQDSKVKAMLCEALGRINDEKSVSLLSRVLADSTQSELVRAVAGHALATMDRKDTEVAIKKLIDDHSVPAKVRSRMMMAVGQRGLDDIEWLGSLADGSRWPKGKDISQDEFGMILNAQRALGLSTNPRATEKLIELAGRFPANANLIEALGRKHDARALPVLSKCLERKDVTSTAQHQAAIALGEMKSAQAVEPLLKAVKNHPDPLVAVKAAEALAKIGDKRALGGLQQVVDGLKSDPRFNESGGAYWKQDAAGWGPIFALKKAVAELKAK